MYCWPCKAYATRVPVEVTVHAALPSASMNEAVAGFVGFCASASA